ncbi:MAG: hypothetical protein IRZ16_19985 [Myxococcaceae bacterium]|nr:hypothetical protein [Myxococcaceae bacterium]
MSRLFLATSTLSLLACGSFAPKAGDACSPEGSLACESPTMGLECRDGTLRSISCRGPGGCLEEGNQVRCDPTHAEPGDGCAAA